MNEITQLLRDAAQTPSELDLDRVHREGRRRRQRPRRIVGAVVAGSVLAAGAVFVVARDDRTNTSVSVGPATQPQRSTTVPPTTTPASTSAPAATSDRLSSASRLGYAGLGPITLGMTFEEAERAGDVKITPADCPEILTPGAASGLAPITGPYGNLTTGFSVWARYPYDQPYTIDEIDVMHPAIFTISGVHVGSTYDEVLRTYPNAVHKVEGQLQGPGGGDYVSLTITNPEGRTIEFYFSLDRVVTQMSLGLTPTTASNHRKC